MCDRAKNLTCSLEVYECRYGTTTTTITTAVDSTIATTITTTSAPFEESTSEKSNVGAIVGGALGGLVFLAVLAFVAYRCGGKRGNTADAHAVEIAAQEHGLHGSHGGTTFQNPNYSVRILDNTDA